MKKKIRLILLKASITRGFYVYIDDFIDKLVKLMKSISLPTRLRDLSLREQDIETILEGSIHPDRMKNNPAQLNKEDIRTILTNTF